MPVNFYSQECDYLPSCRTKIVAWVRAVIAEEGFRVGDVTFVFCSQEYHIGINRQYLGHDYHTDVITFDNSESSPKKIIGGDILIDPVRVAEQAAEWGTDPREEELRVMIHGVLHLCGYQDDTDEAQKIMRAKENHYLTKFN